MKKIETIYHHLLYTAQKEGIFRHTQQELAQSYGYSLSTINHALSIPENIGAIRKESKFFVVADFKKLLYYWASVRNLDKDIYFQTYVDLPIMEIEGLIPPQSIFAGYTAARKIIGEPPADYAHVYFYTALSPGDLAKRFPVNSTTGANVHALQLNPTMTKFEAYTSLPQTFVDIWNLRDWYAHDFTSALEAKMYDLLS